MVHRIISIECYYYPSSMPICNYFVEDLHLKKKANMMLFFSRAPEQFNTLQDDGKADDTKYSVIIVNNINNIR